MQLACLDAAAASSRAATGFCQGRHHCRCCVPCQSAWWVLGKGRLHAHLLKLLQLMECRRMQPAWKRGTPCKKTPAASQHMP